MNTHTVNPVFAKTSHVLVQSRIKRKQTGTSWPWLCVPFFKTMHHRHLWDRNQAVTWDELWKRATSIAGSGGLNSMVYGCSKYDRHVHTLTKLVMSWLTNICNRGAVPLHVGVICLCRYEYLRCWELYRMSLDWNKLEACRMRPTQTRSQKVCSWFAGRTLVIRSQWFRRTAGQLVTGYYHLVMTVTFCPLLLMAWHL